VGFRLFRERPCRRAAEQRDELTSPHGLPSSDWRPDITTPPLENAAVRHQAKLIAKCLFNNLVGAGEHGVRECKA